MSSPISSCTGFVHVLEDQQQSTIQHRCLTKSPLAKPDVKAHKLCTVVENGQVMVRPIEPLQNRPKSPSET